MPMLDSTARDEIARMVAEHNDNVTWPHRLSTAVVAAAFLRGADARADDVAQLAVAHPAGLRRAAAFVAHARAFADQTCIPPCIDRDLLPTGRVEAARRIRHALSVRRAATAAIQLSTDATNKESSR